LNKVIKSNKRNMVLLVFLIVIILITVGISVNRINKRTGYTTPSNITYIAHITDGELLK